MGFWFEMDESWLEGSCFFYFEGMQVLRGEVETVAVRVRKSDRRGTICFICGYDLGDTGNSNLKNRRCGVGM